jgi:hypothetical protein
MRGGSSLALTRLETTVLLSDSLPLPSGTHCGADVLQCLSKENGL